jgi:hypothetical protein
LAIKTDKVTVLITAESIIAGFMIAYGGGVGPNLLYWSEKGGSLLTTYFAGLLTYATVLTCFASILLLFKSLDAEEENDVRYSWGYRLFIVTILMSCFYVGISVVSIYHFTVSADHKPLEISVTPLADWLVAGFSGYVVFLIAVWIGAWRKNKAKPSRPKQAIPNTTT